MNSNVKIVVTSGEGEGVVFGKGHTGASGMAMFFLD